MRYSSLFLLALVGCAVSPDVHECGTFPKDYKAIVNAHLDETMLHPESRNVAQMTKPAPCGFTTHLGEKSYGYGVFVTMSAQGVFGAFERARLYIVIREGEVRKVQRL